MADEECDGDVPPLEDMSELLDQVSALNEYKHQSHVTPDHDLAQRETVMIPEQVHQASDTKEEMKKVQKKGAGFGGMKKGFLFGPSPSKSKCLKPSLKKSTNANGQHTNSSDTDIPFIRPTNCSEKEPPLQIPEVQEAMKIGEAFAQNKDWVTDDLLQRIEKNQTLSQRLTDPKFVHAISEFQTNPEAAMQKYGSNPEMQNFLKEFMGLMGDHFTKLGDKQPGGNESSEPKKTVITKTPLSGADISVHSTTDPKQPTAAEEQRFKEIIDDPEIREILLDARIQALIEALRTNPDKAQNALRTADGELQNKIQQLVKAGLLQFER